MLFHTSLTFAALLAQTHPLTPLSHHQGFATTHPAAPSPPNPRLLWRARAVQQRQSAAAQMRQRGAKPRACAACSALACAAQVPHAASPPNAAAPALRPFGTSPLARTWQSQGCRSTSLKQMPEPLVPHPRGPKVPSRTLLPPSMAAQPPLRSACAWGLQRRA